MQDSEMVDMRIRLSNNSMDLENVCDIVENNPNHSFRLICIGTNEVVLVVSKRGGQSWNI